jgi:RHH-type proline utilization regulon transcriptional repressor/proline dehydrogenase/delta 1-pyrroline-5-carboxylate dehydrogenase
MNLSIKLSALDNHFDAIDSIGTAHRVAVRLRELLRIAKQQQAFINIDMESYEKKDLTLHIFKSVLMEAEFREVRDVGIVIQCYLHDSDRDLVELRNWATQRGTPVWVRLVKGAYWDYETVHARYNGWPIPVYQQKWQSDAAFERAARFVMQHHEQLRPAIGSHNCRSIAHAIATAEVLGVPERGYELQMLYGMADAEKKVFVERGHRLRVYMPYGELIPGMAYLVRRLLENTSNDSFLRMSFEEKVDVEHLLRDPSEIGRASTTISPTPATNRAEALSNTMKSFKNQPPIDFAQASNRDAMQRALADVAKQLGREYPLMIDGESISTTETLPSVDPSKKSRTVGSTASAKLEEVNQAVAVAKKSLTAWATRPVEERAEFLRRAAQKMRERHFELAAWAVYECGKPWREATADIDEAIDFCEYYAAGAIALQSEIDLDVPGEENRLIYIPRGVAAVIAPWNFPLAILTGMTVAALVTGNTVVMKPAEQSAIIAAKLMEIFQEIDLPPGVLNYLPGRGEVTGAALVEHPDVALIAFTGSRKVGLAINAKAAEISAKLRVDQVKHVIAEMGGKNAIIIDDDADLDEAVLGVTKSAFNYAGQKCSACSRAIVLESVYDAFLERLVEAARSLPVGPAEDPQTIVGPVIDEESQQRVLEYAALGRREGRQVLAVDVGPLAETGYFVGPHVFADVAPTARVAQEEIFGPILAVIAAKNLDEALAIANGTEYALTGGFYSRSPANIDRVVREFRVGNLYINRNITGAMVSRQPFGGFKMSGIGTKAGGPDYLLQFVLPRTITENLMRRGFAPPEAGE